MQNLAIVTHNTKGGGNYAAQGSSDIPLPKVNIPKFNGEYNEWPTFYDLFKKVIHERSIPAVEKMWYIKTNLTGEAERPNRHLALTENNYDTAWRVLQHRFNNKRILINSILQQIMEHPNISSEATAIQGFHGIIQENLSALTNLGTKI